MNFQIVQKHITLTEEQVNYIQEKIEHLKKMGDRVGDESTLVRVDIEHNEIKTTNKNIELQVTIYVPHAVIRAEVRGLTPEEAIDLAEDKLRKQLERYKSRKNRRDQTGKWIPASTLESITSSQDVGFEVPKILKRKLFGDLQVMHEEEAVEQMELLGHNFFAFTNQETKRFSVVYRREDGTYGLLEMGN